MAGTGKAHLRDGDRVLSIEDLVVVTSDGHRVLTHHPKQPFAT